MRIKSVKKSLYKLNNPHFRNLWKTFIYYAYKTVKDDLVPIKEYKGFDYFFLI